MIILVIVESIIILLLFIFGCRNIWNMDKELDKATLAEKKHLSMFFIMNNWLEAKQQQKKMDIFLNQRGYHKIAIYGMHYIGERLFKELENTQIQVLYGIDQNKDGSNCGLEMYRPGDELPTADAIIVTTPLYYYSIKRGLSKKVRIPIISIAEVVEGMC